MPPRPQRPKLGQNFLVSPTAQAAIADALGDISHRTVVEIGPGRGAITTILARRAQRLVAIELDDELAAQLRSQFADSPNVEIVHCDVLAANLADFRTTPGEKLLVIGNLPYYITSDILLALFAAQEVIERAVIMIQREVAERVAAAPQTSDYGLLSATAQLYARVETLLHLPPSAFSPPPQVHSTVLRLTMRPRFEELGVTPDDFIPFLRIAFSQKRKMLAKNLRTCGHDPAKLAAGFAACGINPRARAEELALESMACLIRELRRQNG